MSDGRKNNGGRRPGSGRKPKPVEDAQQSILLAAFDAEAEKAVVENMIDIAKSKNPAPGCSPVAAATWLWDRKYGKIKDQVEASGGITIKVIYDDPDREAA